MVATQAITAQKGAIVMKSVASKAAPAGGAFFAGKGLGLGLGIGVWGPVILVAVGTAAVYGYVRSRRAENAQAEEEIDLADAIAEI